LVLSNTEIVRCLKEGLFIIDPIAGLDPAEKPFNTSAVDLRLSNEILIPKAVEPIQLDLNKPGITSFLRRNSTQYIITEETPYSLKKDKFILALTAQELRARVQ
jgi:dCTP deaminase